MIVLELNGFARKADNAFDVVYLVWDQIARAVHVGMNLVARILEDNNIAALDLALR